MWGESDRGFPALRHQAGETRRRAAGGPYQRAGGASRTSGLRLHSEKELLPRGRAALEVVEQQTARPPVQRPRRFVTRRV